MLLLGICQGLTVVKNAVNDGRWSNVGRHVTKAAQIMCCTLGKVFAGLPLYTAFRPDASTNSYGKHSEADESDDIAF